MLFKHGRKHTCPYPGCKTDPMPLKSLLRHWGRFSHGLVFDQVAAFGLCGRCGEREYTSCGCDGSKPFLLDEDLVALLATNVGVLPRFV